MIHIKDLKLEAVHDSITHGFFGRQGGVSQGLYKSLNCGPGSQDNSLAVRQNRTLVAKALEIGGDDIATVWQIHSADCLVMDEFPESGEKRPRGDAIVTDKPNFPIGCLTADCAPLLFAGKKQDGSPVVGAAHSGWGGSLKGIGEATIDKMLELGMELETVCVAIGPCIGARSYEVSVGFEKPFLERAPDDERFFRGAQKEGHLIFDMSGYIANRLAMRGVRYVTITGQDTFVEEDKFFSYRRATHRAEPDYGRQISAIGIKE